MTAYSNSVLDEYEERIRHLLTEKRVVEAAEKAS